MMAPVAASEYRTMRAVFDRDALVGALTEPCRAISRRNTLPILANVHVAATSDGRWRITGTDLESMVETVTAAAETSDYTATTIPAAELLAAVRAMPRGSSVALDSAEDDAHITLSGPAGVSRTFATIAAGEYPSTLDGDRHTGQHAETVRVSAATFAASARRVAMAAATDAARPILTGAQLRVGYDDILLAAADNYRIVADSVPVLGAADIAEPFETVIPAAALSRVARAIGTRSAEDMTLTVWQYPGGAAASAVFAFGRTRIASRIIGGQYPNWSGVMPAVFSAGITLDSAALVAAAKGIGRSRIIRCAFDAAGLALTVHGADTDDGAAYTGDPRAIVARAIVPGDAFAGDPGTIALNPAFVRDLATFATGPVRFETNGPLSPAVFSAGAARYVVMPVRVAS